MKLKSKQYYIRKSHRYLGLVLGVQFLFWTLGGLYFSWNDIDKVHGDHLRKEKRYFPADLELVSPGVVMDAIKTSAKVDSVHSVQLIEIAGMPAYQVRYFSGEMDHSAHEAGTHMPAQPTNIKVQLASAQTGKLIPALTEAEAVTVAKIQMADPVKVEKVEYLTEVGGITSTAKSLCQHTQLPSASQITAQYMFLQNWVLFRPYATTSGAYSIFYGCCTRWIMKEEITSETYC